MNIFTRPRVVSKGVRPMKKTMFALVLLAVAFALAQGASSGGASFMMAVVGDRTGGHIEGIYPVILSEVAARGPDIVLTVGDHIEGYGDDMEYARGEWDTIAAMYEVIEAPVYMTPGNHDIWSDDSEALWTEVTGHEPYYSFDFEGAHFVVLDVSRINEVSDFPEEQMEWLVSDLEANASPHTYVFLHKPLWLQTLGSGRPDPLHDVFRAHGVEAVLAGHHHRYYSANYDGIAYYALGSSGGGMSYDETYIERGNFIHFGWMTVSDEGHELVLVHEGREYPSDIVTVGSLKEIARIESEVITMTPLRAADRDAPARYPVTVRVVNESDRIINSNIVWEAGETWRWTPEEYPFRLTPGESGEFEFHMLNAGGIYPLPRMTMKYPLGDGEFDVLIDLPLKRSVSAARFGLPPEIDGRLTEDAWPTDGPVPTLYPSWEGSELEGETAFFFGYDDENLYLGAICLDEAASGLTSRAEERDGPVYNDDCVGYFLQPPSEEGTVYQIYVNPSGVVFDQEIVFLEDGETYQTDVDWDGEMEVATHRDQSFWSAEIRIPHAALGGDADYGTVWGLNFRRKQAGTNSAVEWQVPIDYHPSTFGELSFQ